MGAHTAVLSRKPQRGAQRQASSLQPRKQRLCYALSWRATAVPARLLGLGSHGALDEMLGKPVRLQTDETLRQDATSKRGVK
eukprot:CAMPEP_0206141224 /NCGR_PEP_ID=MMETSP1473-20131121/12174_1 /ASSEMBLY_ACC=CAM_ASM_001109 /TAXON_ID=1461547 /ORGANISM="Stichococcus sp, Strain RCC1054" /LENGTH=81 /DNA_ID=CAMNT_0053535695 /DNA_START=346 /DNA_END=592 /DNA_ORIENTATION=-